MRFVLVAALTIIAAWLRFSAINFGLPDQLRPDEEFMVPAALGFEEDWNPHIALYPAAQTYLLHGALRTRATLTGAGGNLRAAYGANNGSQAFLIARQLSAAMGTATIPVIYLAAAPMFGPVAALISAAIATVSFIHVRESKFAKQEGPAGFWLALTILMMSGIISRGHWMDYGLAGLFCGLSAATHYIGGAIAIGVLAAHLEGRHREGRPFFGSLIDPRIYFAGFVTILIFVCLNPYLFIDWQQSLNTIAFVRASYVDWNGWQIPAGYGWAWLLLRAMPAGFGIGLEIFLLAAILWVIFRPRPGTYTLLAFIAICFLTLTHGHPQLEFRYLVNPLLAMVMLGGLFAVDLTALSCSFVGTRIGRTIAVLAVILLLAPSLIRDVQLNQLLGRKDTRAIARDWMVDHIPANSVIILVGNGAYGKPRVSGRYRRLPINDLQTLLREKSWATWVLSDSFPPLPLWSEGPSDAEVAALNSGGTVEFDQDSLKPGAVPPVFDPNDAFYAPFSRFTSMTRPGPRIRIWKLRAVSR